MGCCGKRSMYPSVRSMAKDISATVLQAMRQAISSGEVLADEELIRKRLSTCNRCEKKTGVRCRECGCYITLKTAVLVAECPLRKWPRS